MCGIVAIYSPDRPIPSGVTQRATKTLAHRGPDGSGVWEAVDGRVALGHTRLCLIDPEASQPLESADAPLRLVVNGELYGYQAIQRQLRSRGHQLRTRSDSEIILHLYEEQGTDCLSSLRGEFAFVLWDEARQALFAARDRFGIKPLFYAQVGSVLYLASEAKALLAAGVPAAWDETALFQSLHLCFDASRSLFAGIRQVPPAHMLIASADGVRIERYWDIPYPRRGERSAALGDGDAIEHVRTLLEESVRLRMEADVPVGCLLSGGVDSSTVLALAARHSDRPVAAFTIGFNQAEYDESELARTTVKEVGAEFHLLAVDDRDLADCFAEGVRYGEMMQFNAHGSARFLLSREIHRAGYRAVMAGEGADELFAGYAFLRSAMLLGHRGWLPSPWWLSAGLRMLLPRTPARRELARVSPWLARLAVAVGEAPVETLVERVRVVRAVLSRDFVARFDGLDPYLSLYESLDGRAALRGMEPAKAMLYVWLRTLFANYHMAADRIDMAHAVEVRMPYLDHVLFEYASRIPIAQLAKDGQNKSVLREVARPWLSDGVRTRVKKPFLAPPATATPGNALHDFAQDTLRGTTLPFVDRAAIIRLLDSLPERQPAELHPIEAILMALVSLTILDRQYLAG